MKNVFGVGDRVVVRSYEDMAKEYGDIYGTISLTQNGIKFPKEMSHLCGEHGTVFNVIEHYFNPNTTRIYVRFDNESTLDTDWAFADYMFELETPIDFSTSDVKDLYGL